MAEHTPENDAPTCPDCDHQYADGACVGPPTPSDLWAGVTPSKCDCDGVCASVIPPEEGQS